ncbi:hypothetical protein HPB50_000713 [Hyalomma asiaticum]|uniref:Uncharacterized protein n=1 Tax=Hyalomma asiaticum TaxID=266040 RepID=A0ACB7STZ1_HYAAI|nr:hypothetical protein HPB50_000713 [Hyalomma asiaticum]
MRVIIAASRTVPNFERRWRFAPPRSEGSCVFVFKGRIPPLLKAAARTSDVPHGDVSSTSARKSSTRQNAYLWRGCGRDASPGVHLGQIVALGATGQAPGRYLRGPGHLARTSLLRAGSARSPHHVTTKRARTHTSTTLAHRVPTLRRRSVGTRLP